MPIPVIYLICAGVVALLGGVAIGINWDTIVRKLTGKRIAILGERGVGKTTMYSFLCSGSVPEGYELTEGHGLIMKGRRFSLSDLKLVVKDGRDVPGSSNSVKYLSLWKKTVEESDIVILMVRADKLAQNDRVCRELAVSDARHISEWRRSQEVFLVGTHLDLMPNFDKIKDDNAVEFVDQFRAHESVKELARILNIPPERLLLGSQRSRKHTQLLVTKMLSAMTQ